MIRKLEKSEFRQVADLSLRVFTRCGAKDFNAEGLETFNRFVYAAELMNELTVYGAFKIYTHETNLLKQMPYDHLQEQPIYPPHVEGE